jgi:DNA invertase Pin-like site-specific DNA recombinase
MRVAAYVRVSTSRQVKLETIEQQLEMVRKHAREQEWELPEEDIFRDDGYSGTTLKRPALDALRDKARMRELEVVVVLSPDRLARNYVHQMVLIEELEKKMKFKELLANSLILQNAADMTEVLHSLAREGYEIRREHLAQLSPYLTGHVKRFGDYVVDLDSIPAPLNGKMPTLVG